MIRRSSTALSTLLGAALAATFLAGCGAATTTPARSASPAPATAAAPAHSAVPSGSAAASGSPAASGSTAASGSPSAEASDPLPHANAALEDLLPSTIGNVSLVKFSLTLSAYNASATRG